MHPKPHRRPLLLLAIGAILIAACGADRNPTCAVDFKTPGYEPDLERGLKTLRLDGQAPTTLDSGQNCSDQALGTFAQRGIEKIAFAGATWDLGGGTGVTIAVITRPDGPLPLAYVEEFYEVGARTGRRTSNIEVSRPTVAGVGPVFRVDALNDLSLQTVVVWEGTGEANVVIVATPVGPSAVRADHDALVDRAVAAALSSPP